MPHICVNSPIPTIDSLMASFAPVLTYPPSFSQIPGPVLNFLGLPNPLMGTLHMPNVELTTLAIHLQSFQLQKTIMGMIQPMLSYVGQSLSSFLPDIPGLPGFTLVDLLSGEVTALVNGIKAAIANNVHLPFVPPQIYGTLKMNAASVPHILMAITSGYIQNVVTLIVGLVKRVTDKLKISAMATLPTFPSFESVLASLQGVVAARIASLQLPNLAMAIKSFPGINQLQMPKRIPAIPGMPGVPPLTLASLVAGLGFPGFPAMPMLPDPLIPSFNIPTLNVQLALTMLMNHLSTGLLIPIMNFINNTLKNFLSFTFPLICIDL